jgi:hypothetical protein
MNKLPLEKIPDFCWRWQVNEISAHGSTAIGSTIGEWLAH